MITPLISQSPDPRFQILLYYKYVRIENPEKFQEAHKALCQRLNLRGRIIIAKEGINGTVEGLQKDTEKYIQEFIKDKRFSNMHFKKSTGTGYAFPKLSIRVRDEIVSLHLGKKDDVDPKQLTGKYISPQQLHQWIHSDKKFYIIDMRNDYEQKSGYFENSVLPGMENFRDLPTVITKLKHLKDETIVTVCTGGVRCEKASGFLIKHGFSDIYQLEGGIVTYMEQYPNQDFKGKLYVFDQRLLMGFNTDSPSHQIVATCEICHQTSENYINCANNLCHRHFICCISCHKDNLPFCDQNCYQQYQQQIKTK